MQLRGLTTILPAVATVLATHVATAGLATARVPAAPTSLGRATLVVPSYAGPPAVGPTCGLLGLTDPTVEGGDVDTGMVWGGPLTASTPGSTISLSCTVQVGRSGKYHSGPDAATVGSPSMPQTAAISPTLVSYIAPEGQPTFLCTEATIDGTRYYWDPVWGWTTDPNTAQCSRVISQPIHSGPVGYLLDWLFVSVIDPVACSVLAVLFPPYGDIPGIWDCPPYGA